MDAIQITTTDDGTELTTPYGVVTDDGPVVLISVWLVDMLRTSQLPLCQAGAQVLGRGTGRVTDDALVIDIDDGSRVVYDLHLSSVDAVSVYVGVCREKLDESIEGGEKK